MAKKTRKKPRAKRKRPAPKKSKRVARISLGQAEALVDAYVQDLVRAGVVEKRDQVLVAGSIRRRRPQVKDADLLLVDVSDPAWAKLNRAGGRYAKMASWGPVKAQLRYFKFQIDVRRVDSVASGAALEYFTGPKGHNVGMRAKAKRKGLKLNEYGLFDLASGTRIAGDTERSIYEALGHPWKPPQLRGTG
jgi:DNA polymerase (family 10)